MPVVSGNCQVFSAGGSTGARDGAVCFWIDRKRCADHAGERRWRRVAVRGAIRRAAISFRFSGIFWEWILNHLSSRASRSVVRRSYSSGPSVARRL